MARGKRTALRIALFAALVFAGDRLLGAAFASALPHSQYRFSLAARGGQPANVLILGDSRAVNGFYAPDLTKRLETPVLNLGYNGMSTLVSEAVLRDYLERNATPRLLVYEITNVQDSQELLDGLMCYWSAGPALRALAAERSPTNYQLSRLVHLYAFNGEVPLRALFYARRSDQDWINRYRVSEALRAATRADPDFELKARPENLEALGRIVALAHERGVPLRLVVTPYLPEYVAHASNWDAWVARLAGAAGGSERIWDYGHFPGTPDQFADRLHLNDRGSAPFADQLARDGFFSFDALARAE
jgi:hypothetical protein